MTSCVCELLNECMHLSYFQKFMGPLPDNNIILQTTEKTLTSSHMETMQYLIAKLLFESKVLGDEMGTLGLSVLPYSVSLSHIHRGYPFCGRTALPSCRRGDPLTQASYCARSAAVSVEEFLHKMRLQQAWPVIWALLTAAILLQGSTFTWAWTQIVAPIPRFVI